MMLGINTHNINYNIDNSFDKIDPEYLLKLSTDNILRLFPNSIIAIVRDKNGKVIKTHKQKLRSLTEKFLAFISVVLVGTNTNTTSATATNLLTTYLGLPSSQSTSGGDPVSIVPDYTIQVGSGSQTFSPTISSLVAPISNGSGAGQLSYGSVGMSFSSSGYTFSITLTNNTSSTINVSEIGLIGIFYISYNQLSNYSTYQNLISYDTFSPAISIPAGGNVTFQINLSFTG